MKRKDAIAAMENGTEVAVVRGESWTPYFGIITDVEAERRVFHGSRDFRGSLVYDGIAVRMNNDRVEVFPLNQIKDAAETRATIKAQHDRKTALLNAVETQKTRSEQYAREINESLAGHGVMGARVIAKHAYGDYRITGWEVAMDANTAEAIVGLLVNTQDFDTEGLLRDLDVNPGTTE